MLSWAEANHPGWEAEAWVQGHSKGGEGPRNTLLQSGPAPTCAPHPGSGFIRTLALTRGRKREMTSEHGI